MRWTISSVFSVIIAACFVSGCATGPGKPLIEDFDTAQKIDRQSQKYFQVIGGDKIQKFNARKIGIVEFYVEFLQGEAEKNPDFSEDYYSQLTREMYDILTTQLAGAGLEIVPLESISGHEAYGSMELVREAKAGGHSAARTTLVPMEGLGLYPSTGWGILDTFKTFKEAKDFSEKEMQIVNDIELDGIAHINLYVSQGISGAPEITSFDIAMSIEYDKKQARSYFRSNAGLRLKEGKKLESRTMVKNENGTVDLDKYREALIELTEILSKMAKASFGYYLN